MRIKAVGKKGGYTITVVVTKDNGKYLYEFSGCNSILFETLQGMIADELEEQYIIAGTYVPPVESDVNVLNVLTEHFFDEPPQIEAEGIEEMPYEDGVIY